MTNNEIKFLVKVDSLGTYRFDPAEDGELVRVFAAGGYLGVFDGEVALTIKGRHMLSDQLAALACEEVGAFVSGGATRKVKWLGTRWQIPTWEVEVYGRKVWVGLASDGKLAEVDEP